MMACAPWLLQTHTVGLIPSGPCSWLRARFVNGSIQGRIWMAIWFFNLTTCQVCLALSHLRKWPSGITRFHADSSCGPGSLWDMPHSPFSRAVTEFLYRLLNNDGKCGIFPLTEEMCLEHRAFPRSPQTTTEAPVFSTKWWVENTVSGPTYHSKKTKKQTKNPKKTPKHFVAWSSSLPTLFQLQLAPQSYLHLYLMKYER